MADGSKPTTTPPRVVGTNRATVTGVFAHPITLLCLAGWLVNDHVLKAAFGNWLTGKLSDVFGLVVFALLVAVVLPRPEPRRIDWAVAITAIFFTSINVSHPANAIVLQLLDVIVDHPHLTPDVTDLVALPALGLARWIWWHPVQVGRRARRTIGWGAFALACFASMATSTDGLVHSDRMISRVEQLDDGSFVALHQRLLLADDYAAAEDAPLDPRIAGVPPGWGHVVYRSNDAQAWVKSDLDPDSIDWTAQQEACLGGQCFDFSGELPGAGRVHSGGVAVFEVREPPEPCGDDQITEPALNASSCIVDRYPGPLDIAANADEDAVVVALGTEGVAVFDGERWTQIGIDTPGPRSWIRRNLDSIALSLALVGVVALGLLAIVLYRVIGGRNSGSPVQPQPPAPPSRPPPPPQSGESDEAPGQ